MAAAIFCAHLGVLLIFGVDAMVGFSAGMLFTVYISIRSMKNRYEGVMKDER